MNARNFLIKSVALGTLATAAIAYAGIPVRGTIPVYKGTKAMWSSLAKISGEEARKRALTEVPGTIVEVELEEEDGFLVYSVEIIDDKYQKREVIVDAGDGSILATEYD